MTEEQARKKIVSLVALAKRPGTPSEGKIAKQTAINLSKKYNIPCEFVEKSSIKMWWEEVIKEKPQTTKKKNEYVDWVKKLKELNWEVYKDINRSSIREVFLRRKQSEICFRHYKDGSIPEFEALYISNFHSIGDPQVFVSLENLLKVSEYIPRSVNIKDENKHNAEAFQKAYGRI